MVKIRKLSRIHHPSFTICAVYRLIGRICGTRTTSRLGVAVSHDYAYELAAAEQMALDEAEDYVAEAEAELAQYTTTETNTAAVVLGVLAALVVVGIGVVALAPRLDIELPWQ